MIPLVAAAALAAPELDRYPIVAPVVLEGPARIHVPLELRSLADPQDGTDLLLVNGAGEAVPFARLQGAHGGREAVDAVVAPTTDPTRFVVTPSKRVDELEVKLPEGVPAARVTVVPRGAEPLASTLVWRFDEGALEEVDVPGLAEPFEVWVEPTTPGLLARHAPSFTTWRDLWPGAPVERRTVQLGYPHLQENGWARWIALAEPPLPWQSAVVLTPEPQLDRPAALNPLPWHDPGAFSLGWETYPTPSATLRRRTLQTGDVAESLRVPVNGEAPSDHLALYVETGGRPLPTITGLELELEGVQLVVLDPGPGPHQLYAGAPPGTSDRWDLGTAWEIAEGVDRVVEPGAAAANPGWVPPEARGGIAEPGTPLDPTRFHWQRTVSGTGLVRVPLPPEVITGARPDLADLRLVQGDRQIPFVLRPSAREMVLEGVATERSERGASTELRVHLPEENLPVVWLTLTTDAEVFARAVTVSRPGPQGPVPLRVVTWTGDGRAERVTVEVPGPVDRELLVTIENGDNPPLPLGEVEAVTDGRELVALLPEGEPTLLLYGAPTMDPPRYDLVGLPTGDLARRAALTAELGPAELTRPPSLSTFHRILLGAALGVFALGLLGLLADTLRRLPDTEPAAG